MKRSLSSLFRGNYIAKFPPFVIGLIFLIFGIVTYFNLIKDINYVVTLLCTVLMLSGTLEVFFAIMNKSFYKDWKWSFSFGLLSFIIGVLLLSEYNLTIEIISFYLGVYFIFRSFITLNFVVDLYRANKEKAKVIFGLVSVLLISGFLLIWMPQKIHSIVNYLNGVALLLTGYLIFYTYSRIRNKINQSNRIINL